MYMSVPGSIPIHDASTYVLKGTDESPNAQLSRLKGNSGDKRGRSTTLNASLSTARPMASTAGYLANWPTTQSCPAVLATMNAAAAPAVLPSDTMTVPLATPNTNPAPRVRTDAGTNSTAAGMYARPKSTAPQGPAPCAHSSNLAIVARPNMSENANDFTDRRARSAPGRTPGNVLEVHQFERSGDDRLADPWVVVGLRCGRNVSHARDSRAPPAVAANGGARPAAHWPQSGDCRH